ncbi:MAG: hypothetical protein QNJ22_12930 [Desulfosarcinaceae bacterium]|nr:hypothetical protein [Desulfosarcinaceae bacterium]
MTAERQDGGFRLSFDEEPEEDSDRQLQSEIEGLKVEKLSQRVTLITILIPILIVVILGVTYLDIKRRVISTETTGSKGFESLSRDLESRFSSLSLRQAKLEEAFSKEITQLNEASAAMGVRVTETDAALKAMGAAAATQKTLEKMTGQTLAAMEEKLIPLTQQLTAANERLTAQGQDTTARLSELEGLLATMDPVLAGLRASIDSLNDQLAVLTENIDTLSAEKISKEQMDLALKLDRFRIISDLQAQDKELEQQLGEMSRQITQVRGELVALENRLYPHKKRTLGPQPSTPPATKSTPGRPAAQEGITEQDLN